MTGEKVAGKRRKWLKVLAWTCCAMVIPAAAGLHGMNLVIDKVTGSPSGMDVDSLLRESFVVEPVVADVFGGGKTASSGAGNGANSDSAAGTDGSATNKRENGHSETGVADGAAGEGAAAADEPREGKSPDGLSGLTDSAEVAAGKAKQNEGNVTPDEMAIVSILLSKLDASDIAMLTELAGGGLTGEEERAARALLIGKLTGEEFDSLIAIAQKYGISEEKTHAEAKKEQND